ncbi:unnamed protein product, partial [marine sediment metagenome]
EFDIEKCTLCHKCIDVCEQNTLADFTETKIMVKAPVLSLARTIPGEHCTVPER